MSESWVAEHVGEVSEAIFKLKVELPDGRIVERDFSFDFEPNYDLLEEQLAETPAQYAFVSAILAEQKHIVNKLERQIIRRRAIIAEKVNETAKADGMKLHKYVLDEIVEADDKILELQTKLMLAQRTMSKLFGFSKSIEMKSEHLRSLAGFKRQEMRDS